MAKKAENLKQPPKPSLDITGVSSSTLIREHCPFKLKPCNYTGRGWYDRCVGCKDNNSFIRPKEDSSKPF